MTDGPTTTDLTGALGTLIERCELDVPAAAEVIGRDPVLPTAVRVGDTAAVALGALASGLAELHWQSTGQRPTCQVDAAEAAAAVMSLFHTTVNGQPLVPVSDGSSGTDMSHANPTVDLYRTADERWIHLHGAFPHLAEATLDVLGCTRSREAIRDAVAARQASELEEALAAARTCGAVARTADEWIVHPHGQLLAATPPVAARFLGTSPAQGPIGGTQPLSGIRVLDLTRVIAGPTVGKLLAAHGAEVLQVVPAGLDDFATAVFDTGHGKWSAHGDLRTPGDADRLRELAAQADIVVTSARAGTLDRYGFGAEALAERRPGIVVVSVNCFGFSGPWAPRPGFDHLAQAATGLWHAGADGKPELVPAPVCDSVAGYLAAAGAVAALARTRRDGGSYHVTTSLARAAMWVQEFTPTPFTDELAPLDTTGLVVSTRSEQGDVTHLRPPFRFAGIDAGWAHPAVARGAHPLRWPAHDAGLPGRTPNDRSQLKEH